MASPILGVPFIPFVIATFFGVMPATIITVKAGLTLQNLQSTRDVMDLRSIPLLFFLAGLALLPTFKPVQKLLATIFKVRDE